MTKLLLRWFVLSVALWLASYLLPGVHIEGDAFTYAGIAVIFGLINATLGTLTRVFTLPLTFVTLGLWLIGINALMLLVTDNLSTSLRIESFWWAVAAAIVVGVTSTVINSVANLKK
jgi:putative membrane protein